MMVAFKNWFSTITPPKIKAHELHHIEKKEGSFFGRVVRWLNETLGGQCMKGMGNLVPVVLLASAGILCLPLAAISGIFAAFLLGITRIDERNPIVTAFVIIPAANAGIFLLAGECWKAAMENFDRMGQLAHKGY